MAVLFYKLIGIVYTSYVTILVHMKTDLKIKAISLRRQGFSYGDIKRKLEISKSTSLLWTKDVILSSKSQNILATKTEAARKKGRETHTLNTKLKYSKINNLVVNNLSHLKINKTYAKLLCAMLYWGEGSKSSGQVVFTNSDPEMIKAFLKLFRYGFVINEQKVKALLHLHPYHNEKIQKVFWSKITGISLEKIKIFNKTSFGKTIRPGYPGCIAIKYASMDILNELMYYYKEINYLLGELV